MRACLAVILGSCGLFASGCAATEKRAADESPSEKEQPRRPTVRFHLASPRELPDHAPMVDDVGNLIFVSTSAELTERDIVEALAFHGDRGDFVQVRFSPDAAEHLARVTREHVGWRLAILIDGELLSAPTILHEIAGGEASISGLGSAERAAEIAASLSQ